MYKGYYLLFASLARKWKSLFFHFTHSLANKKIIKKEGFTLIELLVVIAILAVLATAVVIILNPGQLIRQARDSTRISDLAALHSAIALYLSDVSSLSLGSTAYCTSGSTTKSSSTACSAGSSTAVTGSGWVTIDFTAISNGSPLARLPVDPNNGSTNCGSSALACFYEYIPYNTLLTYELDASMESTKYARGGGGDVETTDGGDNHDAYEIGNDPGLNL